MNDPEAKIPFRD